MTSTHTPKWEYHVEDFGGFLKGEPKPDALQQTLNEWGEAGWEISVAIPIENSTRWRFIAKRPLTSTEKRRRSMPGLGAELE
jgi:hypothetical protein